MDLRASDQSSLIGRLPRASGDGPITRQPDWPERLVAPRERGWTRRARHLPRPVAGCPARAGMDPALSFCRSAARWLPRASGDGPWSFEPTFVGVVVAPRERGWTRCHNLRKLFVADCPARAGMDPSPSIARLRCLRLPRASGDGPRRMRWQQRTGPAAPHERGWTHGDQVSRFVGHGCPARAGMDLWCCEPTSAHSVE